MYLYRFDPLKSLRSLRCHDPVLRGRRRDGAGDSGHAQVRSAHASVGHNEAVYQLSFWKSFEALKDNLWGHWDGDVIQRIRADHPALQAFQCGVDEFLAQYAWLYWGTFPISSENPDWSPVGIPHADIEVLHPNGEWLRLDDVEVLSDKASDGWTTIYLANGSRKYPIHMAQQQLCNGMQAVLLRHQSAGAFNHSDTQEQVIDFLLDGGHIIGDPKSISWYLAIEMSDEVVVEELQPSITETKTLGVRGVVQRWRGIPPARKWSVHVDVELARSLRSKEVDDLYSQFGVEERLLRGKRWSYRQCSALMS